MTSSDLGTAASAKSSVEGSGPGFSCFGHETNRCRSMIDGDDKFAGSRGWAMGTDASGQAHYACPYCASALFNPRNLATWQPWVQPAREQLDEWDASPAATASPATGSDRGRDEPIPTDRTNTRESEKP